MQAPARPADHRATNAVGFPCDDLEDNDDDDDDEFEYEDIQGAEEAAASADITSYDRYKSKHSSSTLAGQGVCDEA